MSYAIFAIAAAFAFFFCHVADVAAAAAIATLDFHCHAVIFD